MATESMIDAYEELLRESVLTISDLRYELQESRKALASANQLLAARINGVEFEAFDDGLLEDAWDWPEEYFCRHCGAPVGKNFSGNCSMPCI